MRQVPAVRYGLAKDAMASFKEKAMMAVVIAVIILIIGACLARSVIKEIKFFMIGKQGREEIKRELGANYAPFYARDFFFFCMTIAGIVILSLLSWWLGQVVWAVAFAAVIAAALVVLARSMHACMVLSTLDREGLLFNKKCSCGNIMRDVAGVCARCGYKQE